MIKASPHPLERVTYKDKMTDTSRWEHFEAHKDDIFIVTPAKNGTTWMQTIVTFLVFRSSNLDFVPADRSPWFDINLGPVAESVALLKRDNERNIIKTHTPLDGIPFYEGATYIGVYRDPRDAFMSWLNHKENMVMKLDDHDLTAEQHFNLFVDSDYEDDRHSLAGKIHHLRCLWDLKKRTNIHLFHYADLLRNLPAEMNKVAKAINVDIEPDLLSQLAEAANFSNMRDNHEKFVPGGKNGFWHEPKEFLKKGMSGQWQGAFSKAALDRFDARLLALAGDEMAQWILYGDTGKP